MTDRDWEPEDEENERVLYTCKHCGKKFTAPEGFEVWGFCRECQEYYDPPEY